MKKIVALVALALVLGGCSTAQKQIVTACKQSAEGIQIDSNFISDDKGTVAVLEQVTAIDIPADQLENVDALKQSLEAQKEAVKTIDGVSLEYTISDTQAIATTRYEIAKLSDEMLLQFGFIDDFKDDKGNFNIDKIKDYYSSVGIDCTSK